MTDLDDVDNSVIDVNITIRACAMLYLHTLSREGIWRLFSKIDKQEDSHMKTELFYLLAEVQTEIKEHINNRNK